MREVLFRGRRSSGRWVYGWYSEYNGIPTITDIYGEIHRVDSATVGQYTGLRDQNVQRIFEGDLLLLRDETAVVLFEGAAFVIRIPSHIYFVTELRENLADGSRVIGNIHNNPELIGGGGDG